MILKDFYAKRILGDCLQQEIIENPNKILENQYFNIPITANKQI